MLYYIFAILLGLGCPSGNSSNNGQPTVHVNGGGGGDGGTGGDTGQVIPPKPPRINP